MAILESFRHRTQLSDNSMAQERETATRITSLNELREIVAAIRAMAASQMQQALRSLEAIRDYSQQIREALSEAATLLPPDVAIEVAERPNKSGLVIFCAEHGLCGGFNEHLLREAERARAASVGSLALIVVGTRGAQIFRERGSSPDLDIADGDALRRSHRRCTPGRGRTLSDVQRAPYRRRRGRVCPTRRGAAPDASSGIASCHLKCQWCKSLRRQLPPIINLRPQRLFDDIVGEYFFATLENAAMQSFFSENSTRFRTMEAAHQNIRNKSSELTKLMQRLRQDSVTTEILDLISGSEAMASSTDRC